MATLKIPPGKQEQQRGKKHMKCPRCGNEVSRQEAFCGQCGAPNTPPAQPTEMVSAPPLPMDGRLNNYAANPPIVQGAPRTRQLSGNSIGGSYPSIPPLAPSGPNQGTGFYHDATEAISSLPGNIPGQIPQQNFSQGSYPGSVPYGGMSGQGAYPTNNFAGPMYVPQSPMGGTGQAYMYDQGKRGKIAAPPVKQQNNTIVLIVSLCVVVALVSVIGVGTMLFLKGRNGGGEQPVTNGGGSVATATPVPQATAVPTVDATGTAAVNATATSAAAVTPTAVVTPTVAADAGFQWCAPACSGLGYQMEYPQTWSPGATTGVQGYQYTNPTAPDEIVAVKALGQTGSQPGDLLTNDLQTNFASKPGYTAPTSTGATTIGGTTWLSQIASYQSDVQQPIRVVVYATVYQQKSYIIELQANNAQFDGVNQQTFTTMLKSFAFQTASGA